MSKIHVVRELDIEPTMRVRQVSSIFDCPLQEKMKLEWDLNVPIDEKDWNVGLITGPSGCGKSTLAKEIFGDIVEDLQWDSRSVIDNMPSEMSVQDIAEICQAVGFNTIPAWLRPYHVLSTGEKFRVTLARHLLETKDTLVYDEFTSVVDRQVAQIGSYAVQKFIRKNQRKFVAVTCHNDLVEWLQPDWVLNPSTGEFTWRSVRRRPDIEVTISRVPRSAWTLFAPYHYLTADLSPSAQCWGLFIGDQIVAFSAVITKPVPNAKPGKKPSYKAFSRSVCLPDYQGIGLIHHLRDFVASIYAGMGNEVRCYPNHPGFVRSTLKNKNWIMTHRPGHLRQKGKILGSGTPSLGRTCASFKYVGPKMDQIEAQKFLAGI